MAEMVSPYLRLAAEHRRSRRADMRPVRRTKTEPDPVLAATAAARQAIRDAWQFQPAGTHCGFGITLRTSLGLTFRWQNYLTGAAGHLIYAANVQTSALAEALLAEIAGLRAGVGA